METDIKEFRLVKYLNTKRAARYFGGKAAASPIAYYYHIQKYGKVILGGNIILRGLGPYYSLVKDYFESEDLIKFPIKMKNTNQEIRFSDIGYLYQNKDSLFNFVRNGIYWEYKIDKICKRLSFSDAEKKNYYLNPYKTGLQDQNYWDEREDEKQDEWKVLISDMKMLKKPFCPENEKSRLLKTYQKSYKSRISNFYDDSGNRSQTYTNTFVFMKNGQTFLDFDQNNDYFFDDELSPINAVDMQIKNSHIRESLVHEMLKILMASKGWYVNFEVPIKYDGETGRIDFLIKPINTKMDSWKVIEVKLLDNPDAVEQLSWYLKAISYDVNENKEESDYFSMLWNGSKMREVEGIVLCGYPPSLQTLNEAKQHNLKVWTYNFCKQLDNNVDEPLLGIEVKNENDEIILNHIS